MLNSFSASSYLLRWFISKAARSLWWTAFLGSKSIAILYSFSVYHNYLADLLENHLKRYDEAEKEYKIAIDLDPKIARLLW